MLKLNEGFLFLRLQVALEGNRITARALPTLLESEWVMTGDRNISETDISLSRTFSKLPYQTVPLDSVQ